MKRSFAVLFLTAAALLFPAQHPAAAQTTTKVKANPQTQANSAASAHDRHHRRHSNGRRHHHHHRSSTKH